MSGPRHLDETHPGTGTCWLARYSDRPCDGRLDRAHFIPKQTLKREVSDNAEFIWHPMIWRYACRRHHNDLDFGNLRLTREQIPASVETFAKMFNLTPKLDRIYGKRPYTVDEYESDMQAARDGYAP